MEPSREPFGGKYFGIWNVEGDGEPLALFPSRNDAEAELRRRRSLSPHNDLYATGRHHVFPCDIAGAWWNSHDPDPREDDPITLDEIVRAQDGDL